MALMVHRAPGGGIRVRYFHRIDEIHRSRRFPQHDRCGGVSQRSHPSPQPSLLPGERVFLLRPVAQRVASKQVAQASRLGKRRLIPIFDQTSIFL